jgi:hypothetical protein
MAIKKNLTMIYNTAEKEKKILPKGNCPYCDAILNGGISTGWGGLPEMFENYKRKHEEGHPEYSRPIND